MNRYPKLLVMVSVCLNALIVFYSFMIINTFTHPTSNDTDRPWSERSNCSINKYLITVVLVLIYSQLLLSLIVCFYRCKKLEIETHSVSSLSIASYTWVTLSYVSDDCNRFKLLDQFPQERTTNILRSLIPKVDKIPLVFEILYEIIVLYIFFMAYIKEEENGCKLNIPIPLIHLLLAALIMHQIDFFSIKNESNIESKLNLSLENKLSVIFTNFTLVAIAEIRKSGLIIEIIWSQILRLYREDAPAVT
ncbi:hypothetical protein RF11_08728 [Thelohanellus kitauei]|uniref:Uncharacterized protein n=1 Tax=Thelohanellus kitauei TaxID=669202 RepID=A0A0C2N7W8_THEKT|nr:hypothetical protein RF11_08728 [Thelohanellus kitauei]